MSHRLTKLVQGSAARTAHHAVNLAALFFLTPFVVASLGDRLYGLWIVAASLTGYFFLLDFGITAAIGRFIGQGVGQDDTRRVNAIVSNGLLLMSIMGAIVLALTAVIIGFLPHFVAPDIVGMTGFLILLIGLELAFSFPLRTYDALLSANLEHYIPSAVGVLTTLVRTILIVVVLKAGYGILALGIVNFGANLAAHLSLYLIVRIRYPWVRAQRACLSTATIKQLFNFSKYVFAAQAANLLRFRIDAFVIAAFLGLPMVTLYAIAAKLAEQFKTLMIQMTGVLGPLFFQYEGERNYDAIRSRFLSGCRVSLVVSSFIGANLIILGRFFIQNWMGPAYAASYGVLAILAAGLLIALSQSIGIGVLLSLNQHKLFAITNGVEAVANLLLTLLLVKPLGILGVALGTAIPMTIVKLAVQPLVICRQLGLAFSCYSRQLLLPMGVLALFYGANYALLHKVLAPSHMSYLQMAGWLTGELVLYIPFAFFLVLNDEERGILRLLLHRIIKRIRFASVKEHGLAYSRGPAGTRL